MTLNEAVLARQEELLCSLQESIRIPSVQGPAQEGAPYVADVQRCLEHALDTCSRLGLRCTEMDHQVGWCEYGEGEEMIAVLAHLDVVPAGEGWSFEPFGGEIKDGKIFGRGAMDDKGPTMAAIYALAAIRDAALPLKRRIRIIFGTNEETGSQDMKYYIAQGGELPLMGFTPDGEYPVINGEKGIINVTARRSFSQNGPVRLLELSGGSAPNVVPASAYARVACSQELAAEMAGRSGEYVRFIPVEEGLRIEAEGLSAHGSTPELGENALGRLVNALVQLPLGAELGSALRFLDEKLGMETDGAALGIALYDEVSGGLTLNWGTLRGNETELSLKINYRYPVTKCFDDCAPILEKAFESAGFEIVEQSHKASLYIPEDSPLVRTLMEVYTRETGLDGEPKSIGGGTYAKAMPNVVAFGPIFPGDEVREHKPDEFMEVDKLMKNARIIAQAMYQLAEYKEE